MDHVTPEDFNSKVLENDKKTLVLFYATWCPFCTNFIPTFESTDLETTKLGTIINEDENPLWDRFNIQMVPTMIAFEGGKIIARKDARKHVGLTKSEMDSMIKELS